MPIETANYINELVATNPDDSDKKFQGDDQIRLLKTVIKNTFPNITAAVNLSAVDASRLIGLFKPVQTQINGFANINSQVFTGVPTTPTPGEGAPDDQIANVDYVQSVALTPTTLPGQAGKNGFLFSTDGTNGKWTNIIDISVVKPAAGTDFMVNESLQTIKNKTIVDPAFVDSVDNTKKLKIDLSAVATGTTRTLTLDKFDIDLGDCGERLIWTLDQVSFVPSIEIPFDTLNYEQIEVECFNIARGASGSGTYLACQFKIGGGYIDAPIMYASTNMNYAGNGVIGINESSGKTFLSIAKWAASGDGYFSLWFGNASKNVSQAVYMEGGVTNQVNLRAFEHGFCRVVGRLEGIKLFFEGYDISGKIRVYGKN